MRNQNKSIFVIIQIPFQPFYMIFIEIIGRLIQKKNVRLFQQQFGHQNLCALAAGQFRDVSVQTDFLETESTGYLVYFCIDQIKIMLVQQILICTGFIQQIFHFFRGGFRHPVKHPVHFLLHFKEKFKSRFEHITYGHSFFKNSMLIKVTYAYIFSPFHSSLIGHQLSGDNVHKS